MVTMHTALDRISNLHISNHLFKLNNTELLFIDVDYIGCHHFLNIVAKTDSVRYMAFSKALLIESPRWEIIWKGTICLNTSC